MNSFRTLHFFFSAPFINKKKNGPLKYAANEWEFFFFGWILIQPVWNLQIK